MCFQSAFKIRYAIFQYERELSSQSSAASNNRVSFLINDHHMAIRSFVWIVVLFSAVIVAHGRILSVYAVGRLW